MVRGHLLTCRLAIGLYSVYDVVLVTSGAASRSWCYVIVLSPL